MSNPGAFRMNRMNANGQYLPKWLETIERKHARSGVFWGVAGIVGLAFWMASFNFQRAKDRLPHTFAQEYIDADQATKLKDVPIFTKTYDELARRNLKAPERF